MRLGGVAAVLVLAAAPGVAGCSSAAGCADATVTRVGGPGGGLDAVVFVRDCGATTGFSTEVSVVRAGARVSGGGNVFSADDDHGKVPLEGSHHALALDVRWLDGTRLHVGYPAGTRVFRHDGKRGDVRVEYQQTG